MAEKITLLENFFCYFFFGFNICAPKILLAKKGIDFEPKILKIEKIQVPLKYLIFRPDGMWADDYDIISIKIHFSDINCIVMACDIKN